MKVYSKGSAVEIIGAETEEHVFKINTSALAFQTLSASLYSDRVSAIIRELSCNAYDAHVAANKKAVPFEIHLPTQLNSEFIIRDFGTSMTDEQILELYCEYFSSSKQGTNKQIGGFGIGSKSPFSYTDGFTIIARMCGEKRVYSAYVNEQGLPAVVRLSTEDCDEPTGLEVKFPVKPKDISEFEEKARKVLEFFNPAPKVNRPDFKPYTATYKLTGKRWKLRATDQHSGPRVIMGMVPYQVSGLKELELDDIEKKMLNMPLDIFVPVGTVSPAATRESLTNDKATIERLRQLIHEIHDEMEDSIDVKMKDFQNGWDKLDFLKTFRGSHLETFANTLRKKVVEDNSVFAQPVLTAFDFPNLVVQSYWASWNSTSVDALFTKEGTGSITLLDGLWHNKQVEFMVVDKGYGGDKQIREYVKAWDYEKKHGNARLIAIFPKVQVKKEAEFDKVAFVAQAEELIKAFGGPKYTLYSTIPQAQKQPSSYVKSQVPKSIVYNGGRYFNSCWDRTQNDLPDDGVHFYLRTLYGKPVIFGQYEDGASLRKFLTAVQAMPFTDFDEGDDLYGFTPSTKIPEDTEAEWIELTQHVIDKGLEWAKANPQKKQTDTSVLSNTCGISTLATDRYMNRMNIKSLFWQACKYLRSVEKAEIVTHSLPMVFSCLQDVKPLEEYNKTVVEGDTAAVKAIAREIRDRYPLLVEHYHTPNEMCLFYVNAVDNRFGAAVDENEISLVTGECK